jgi:hypothetical protein
MTLFDSNAEVQVEHLEGEITGSQSEKSAYLFAGVMPDNSASFVKMTNLGHLQISGTVGVQDAGPLTIGSFFATASVKIVESFITQSITGSVEVINFPLVQEVTGTVIVSSVETPVNVNQNNSGSIPWKVVLKDEQGETVGSGSNPLVVTGSVFVNNNPVQNGTNGLTNSTIPIIALSQSNGNTTRKIPAGGFSILNKDTGKVKFITRISNSFSQTTVESFFLRPNEKWVSETEVNLSNNYFFTVQLTANVTSSQPEWTISYIEQII